MGISVTCDVGGCEKVVIPSDVENFLDKITEEHSPDIEIKIKGDVYRSYNDVCDIHLEAFKQSIFLFESGEVKEEPIVAEVAHEVIDETPAPREMVLDDEVVEAINSTAPIARMKPLGSIKPSAPSTPPEKRKGIPRAELIDNGRETLITPSRAADLDLRARPQDYKGE